MLPMKSRIQFNFQKYRRYLHFSRSYIEINCTMLEGPNDIEIKIYVKLNLTPIVTTVLHIKEHYKINIYSKNEYDICSIVEVRPKYTKPC